VEEIIDLSRSFLLLNQHFPERLGPHQSPPPRSGRLLRQGGDSERGRGQPLAAAPGSIVIGGADM